MILAGDPNNDDDSGDLAIAGDALLTTHTGTLSFGPKMFLDHKIFHNNMYCM